jgi:DNA-binding transcriptional regulator YbjK
MWQAPQKAKKTKKRKQQLVAAAAGLVKTDGAQAIKDENK